MKARIVFMSLLAILVVLGFLGYSGLLAGPPGEGKPAGKQPPFVSAAEREAMGLDEPTWTKAGKVHPTVQEVLSKEKKLDEIPEKQRHAVLFKPLRPVGFLRMVYVAVYLKHEQQGSATDDRAAIKKVQSLVLSKLTAGEFSVWLRFKDRAAMLGFTNEAGLAKLVKDANVTAIGLDTKPLPLEPREYYNQGVERINGKLPKIDPQVGAALKKSNYVFVVVNLKQSEPRGPEPTDRLRQARKVQDGVLSRLRAEEFRTTLRPLTGSLRGHVNAAGLIKLSEDPDVENVGLPDPPAKMQGFQGRRP